MIRKANFTFLPCLILAMTALLTAGSLAADQGPAYQPHGARHAGPKVELTPFVGFRFGGEFERTDRFGFSSSDRELDETESFGLALGIALSRGLQLEFLFSRQDTELLRDEGFFDPDTVLLDLEVDYYHVGVLYQWTPGQVRPFVAASVGSTVFRPESGNVGDESRFSLGFGGGVKVMLGENFGLRFEGRLFSTLIEDDDDFCDDFYCYGRDEEEYMVQGEVRGGLVFAF